MTVSPFGVAATASQEWLVCLMWTQSVFSQAARRREFAVMGGRNAAALLQRIGKGWRILRGLQVRRVRVGSGTLLAQRSTKAANHMAMIIGIIANNVKEASVAVVASNHNNADTHCWCTC